MLSSSEFYGGSSGGGAGEKYSEVPGLSPLSVDIEMTNGLSLLNQSMNTLSGGSLSDPWSTCSPLSQKSPDTDLVHQMDALLKTEPLDLPCASPSDVELLQMSFQNDQSDTLQGPTLAELNAPPASDLLDDLCFDDLMLPEAASGMRSSSRWDHGLGLDEPSSALGATAAELQSAALESMSAASGVNPHFAFDGPDLMLMGATGFGSRLSSANAGNPTAAANRQNMSLGSSVPSSGLTASFDIAGHRFVLTSSGFAPGNAPGSGAVPIGGTSHLATLLSSPSLSAVGTPPGLGRPIKSEPANAQNPALSSSVPSTCGFSFAQSIMTSGTAPVGVQHQQQVQVQAQAHQVAVAQQQLQNQQMQQLTLLASNLAAVPPSTPTTLIVTSPQQPTQVLQSQLCQMGIGMVGTTVETPSGSSRRSSSASLCSDVISKLTLHNNILHQNRSKAPHQMRPRASTMSGAIGHRRPPKASASSGMQHGNGANGGGLPPQNQPVSGMMKSNFLLASTPDIRLSSSCPNNSMDLVWRKVREPRQHLLSGGSLIESPSHGGSGSSLSTGGVLSPASGAGHDLSHDDDAAYFNSDTEDDDEDSDGDSGGSGDEDGGATSPGAARGGGAHHSGRDRYFWQYNVQAKGPKGQRLVMKKPDPADPHVLDQVVDPVFNPVVAAQGIRHSGKARRGDGNDLTPSPKKLFNIGVELDGLNQAINEMTPVAELPYTDRPKSRKEKNKLASRACRLKKKAQHEANKLTLYGLQEEHRKLMECIEVAKQLIMARLASVFGDATLTMGRELVPIEGPISPKLEAYCDPVLKTRIAGRATDFVNDVLEKVKAGIPNGGLGTLLK